MKSDSIGSTAWWLTIGAAMLLPGMASAQNELYAVRPVPFRLAPASRQHGPVKIHQQRDDGAYESYNWSGYAVTGSQGSTTDIKGSWVVPAVNCSVAPAGYSSFWVGIDGFSSNTVEQIGTDSDCVSLNGQQHGTPTYYAWFEFYPQPSYLIEFPGGIHPGDVISAEVKYAGSGASASPSFGFGPGHQSPGTPFTVSITDSTQGLTFTLTSTVSGAQQSSAEWIAEAPASSSGVLPLADFTSVSFSVDSATLKNVTGGLGSFGASIQSITMVGENAPNALKAQPSGLSGNAFSVTWVSPGP